MPAGPRPRTTTVIIQRPPSNDLGVAGFVSLLGLLTCGCIAPLGLLLSVMALSKQPRGLAIAGTVIGTIGSLWVFALLLLVLLGVVSIPLLGK